MPFVRSIGNSIYIAMKCEPSWQWLQQYNFIFQALDVSMEEWLWLISVIWTPIYPNCSNCFRLQSKYVYQLLLCPPFYINNRFHEKQYFSTRFLPTGILHRQLVKHRVTIPCKRSFDFTWNPPDFTWNLADFMWNPVDFMKSLVIVPTLHSSNWRVFAETLAFIILGGFHRWNLGEIHQISWVKSTRFQGEIHWISRVKSPTLHSSNWRVFTETLAFIIWVDFTGEIWVKSARFHGWNPPDFRVKSGGFQGWNPPPCIHQTEEFLLKHLLL